MHGPERRFSEAEIAAVLERAAAWQEPGRQVIPTGEGLTLAQLQDIGREVGIAPHAIAEAADLLDQREQATVRRFLGLPLGVERVVPLRRRLSDEEWERVVVQLREIFDARGVMKHEGSLRQWTNGNLQAHLEPTDQGQRIRLRTVKGNARGLMAAGSILLGAASAGFTTAVMRGAPGDIEPMTVFTLLGVAGAGMLVSTAVRLIPWARRRREQMAEVAARIAALDRAGPPAGGTPPLGPPTAPLEHR